MAAKKDLSHKICSDMHNASPGVHTKLQELFGAPVSVKCYNYLFELVTDTL